MQKEPDFLTSFKKQQKNNNIFLAKFLFLYDAILITCIDKEL